MRALLLVHRYLGLCLGALVLLWCCSGGVMTYVRYPRLSESRRLQSLRPINWQSCARGLQLPNNDWAAARIEMLDGHPVLGQTTGSVARLIDLESGASRDTVTAPQAATAAAAYAAGSQSSPKLLGKIELDQWTVSGRFAADRPLYHFELGDRDGTELYVSGVTGRLLQATTRKQRFWNWLGPIPHWLYWVELRRHPQQWTQVVVAGSLLGAFLTISGLWLGFGRLPHRPALANARSARGWHRASGLVFGLFTLSWLGSGLVTVQPWGLLESPPLVHEKLQGIPPLTGRLERAISALQSTLLGSDFVSVEITPVNGEPFFVASTADGRRRRFDASGRPAALTGQNFSELAERLGSRLPATRLLRADDDLGTDGDQPVTLPVYRVLLPGAERNALYFDATSGALVAQIDRNARVLRFNENLHRIAFAPQFCGRPLRNVLVLLMLSGIAVSCCTGIWLGLKRLFVRQR